MGLTPVLSGFSVSIDCSHAGARWHACRWDDEDLATQLANQLAQVVEHVIDPRVVQRSADDLPCPFVEATSDLKISSDEQRGDTP